MVTGDALAIAWNRQKLGWHEYLDASGFGDTKRHETAALAESIEKADGSPSIPRTQIPHCRCPAARRPHRRHDRRRVNDSPR